MNRVIHNAKQMSEVISYLSGLHYFNRGWLISVEPYREPRSTGQNSRYWTLIGLCADHCGMHKNDMDLEMRKMFLPMLKMKLGSKEIEVPQHPKELNRVDFGEYYNRVLEFASEFLGVWMDTKHRVHAGVAA